MINTKITPASSLPSNPSSAGVYDPETNSSLPINPSSPWLAPLAGWSDLAFRLLCRAEGAAVCCTEMISAKGLIYKSPGTYEYLRTIAQDSPLVVQLFGAEPEILAQATKTLQDMGFRWFDLNCGCAVPKVMRQGSGAGLMRDPKQALAVAKAMLQVAPGRVGFKFRLGIESSTWPDLALGLQDLGAAWLTLHPRTARQGFTGQAQWEALAELKNLVQIPVLASGDLSTAEQGLACLQQTKVDSLMYARGALTNPGIFANHLSLQGFNLQQPSLLQRIKRHADFAKLYSHEKVALLKMRTSLPRYLKNVENAKELRQAVINCHNWDDFAKLLDYMETTGLVSDKL